MLFPEKTQLNKIIPKTKFIKLANLSNSSRIEMQNNVQRLILSNILRQDTLNVEKGKEVIEIDVFEFTLKKQLLSESLIKEVDENILKHLLFILRKDSLAQLVISYKEKLPNSKCNKVLKLYKSEWQNYDNLKIDIIGLNLDSIFENLVLQISSENVEMGADTNLKSIVEKSIEIEKLERKISMLESKIKSERQFNKKIELKKELREANEQKKLI